MKTLKPIALLLALVLALGMLTACAPTVVVLQEEALVSEDDGIQPVTEGSVKTGLSFVTSTMASTSATEEEDGIAQSDISLVAVTVDENGVIDRCVIDSVQAKIGFDAKGTLTGDVNAPILSKNELGTDYGMSVISPIGKEWNEQVAALASYVEGMTVEEVTGIKINAEGKPQDADLAASVTIYMGGLLAGIEDAVNNAVHLGAQKGDELVLHTLTSAAGSKDAVADTDGLAQAYCTVAVMTLNGDVITGCYLDAVQANVGFDENGALTTELSDDVPSKNTQGDEYGMSAISSIGADWHEQAASFSAYVTGKTVAEAAGIAVSEGKAADADLASSVTMSIGDFLTLMEKAG
ncbi:MAG: hypothetical protein J6J43_04255 [Oscillospiraceae bacterium]|nr:hypothetical protein [Oscillospiraceae bacterium]